MGAGLDPSPFEGHEKRDSDTPDVLHSASRRTTTSSGVLMSPSSANLSAGACKTFCCMMRNRSGLLSA